MCVHVCTCTLTRPFVPVVLYPLHEHHLGELLNITGALSYPRPTSVGMCGDVAPASIAQKIFQVILMHTGGREPLLCMVIFCI